MESGRGTAVADADFQRIILLNRLVSTTVSRAPEEHKSPIHGGWELLHLIDKRRAKKWAIEYINSLDDDDEDARAKKGQGHNFLRLRHCRFEEIHGFRYAILLFEFVDQGVTSFPVVHTSTFTGREIAGDDEERGATAAHVVIRMPGAQGYDDGNYRCAFEAVPPITRRDIETFLSRQIRRADDWTFSVDIPGKRKTLTKVYSYHPKFNLFGDIGRRLSGIGDGRILNYMLFTKRSEKQAVGKATAVLHKDVYADVDLRISAKQGPQDPEEQRGWVEALRQTYKERGFESRLYYRHVNGGTLSGEVHQAVDGAADIMMCPKEIISLNKKPKRWTATINSEIAERMMALLDNDELWERDKQ
jgi:hypothetical protein